MGAWCPSGWDGARNGQGRQVSPALGDAWAVRLQGELPAGGPDPEAPERAPSAPPGTSCPLHHGALRGPGTPHLGLTFGSP